MVTSFSGYDLTDRNTLRMKVSCRLFVEFTSPEDLLSIDFSSLPRPVKVMGGGSNLLFTEEYFPGTILHCGIKGIKEISKDEGGGFLLVEVGAGEVFDDFCAWSAGHGYWGPENLSHIPGEAGASAVQNVGAYGVEAKDLIWVVKAFDLASNSMISVVNGNCHYSYRDSMFKHAAGRYIITSVVYKLGTAYSPRLDYGGVRRALAEEGFSSEAALTPSVLRQAITRIRRAKLPDPEEKGSAGSFFCNPIVPRSQFDAIVAAEGTEVPHYDLEDGKVKIPAAWMIERCGFKGRRSGGAQVWPTQPLVIVNDTGSASSQDILSLEKEITDSIRSRFGITIHPEVEHL